MTKVWPPPERVILASKNGPLRKVTRQGTNRLFAWEILECGHVLKATADPTNRRHCQGCLFEPNGARPLPPEPGWSERFQQDFAFFVLEHLPEDWPHWEQMEFAEYSSEKLLRQHHNILIAFAKRKNLKIPEISTKTDKSKQNKR